MEITLTDALDGVEKYPQHMINVPLPAGVNIMENTAVRSAARELESELGDRGRLILRPSGTEPVVRVTVEAQSLDLARESARMLG